MKHFAGAWKRISSGILVALLCGCTNLQVANSLLIADWAQTHAIRKDPTKLELNPLLGSHPDSAAINTHFLAGLVVLNVLGPRLNPVFLNTFIAIEGGIVARNYMIGIRIPF